MGESSSLYEVLKHPRIKSSNQWWRVETRERGCIRLANLQYQFERPHLQTNKGKSELRIRIIFSVFVSLANAVEIDWRGELPSHADEREFLEKALIGGGELSLKSFFRYLQE